MMVLAIYLTRNAVSQFCDESMSTKHIFFILYVVCYMIYGPQYLEEYEEIFIGMDAFVFSTCVLITIMRNTKIACDKNKLEKSH